MEKIGRLTFFCGKMGSGKSTTAEKVASETGAILISEDEWLSKLFPVEINTFEDYLHYSGRLKPIIKELTQNLLNSGVSVVLDFPGNTKKQRLWFSEVLKNKEYPHKLIYLKADDDLCLSRLKLRREGQPERAAFDNEQVFKQVTAFFQAPHLGEGFDIEVVQQEHE